MVLYLESGIILALLLIHRGIRSLGERNSSPPCYWLGPMLAHHRLYRGTLTESNKLLDQLSGALFWHQNYVLNTTLHQQKQWNQLPDYSVNCCSSEFISFSAGGFEIAEGHSAKTPPINVWEVKCFVSITAWSGSLQHWLPIATKKVIFQYMCPQPPRLICDCKCNVEFSLYLPSIVRPVQI